MAGYAVGGTARAAGKFNFTVRLAELNEDLEQLNAEAHLLEERIAEHVERLLEQVTK
ncbi:hypothetical protein EYB53_011015 [Candidatus Chloroploca sp. M-50]|uniref:Uncharacterized protein n=1 Tax=Candidatus Chloroploca mongolica TaxID=2528176 RepID=A0ABS4D9X1_9CHLR|nr:hypothetical protein [Candidatus Chloroploca mongolica]MBP1466236.1 hypothetical protein [Candidatus Chloroploca mongolica]